MYICSHKLVILPKIITHVHLNDVQSFIDSIIYIIQSIPHLSVIVSSYRPLIRFTAVYTTYMYNA